MRPDHALRLGSVTKTYVAAAVLQLASEGALGLDDPLETWVPGFPGGEEITARQLLNHSSGIFNYTAGVRYGLGVFELDASTAGVQAWGHGGDIFGYHTQMFYFPEMESVIVSIVNSDRGSPNDLTGPALELLLGADGEAQRRPGSARASTAGR